MQPSKKTLRSLQENVWENLQVNNRMSASHQATTSSKLNIASKSALLYHMEGTLLLEANLLFWKLILISSEQDYLTAVQLYY